MTNLTKQEVFSQTLLHLARQGKPAMRDRAQGTCAYRAADGSRCAVGFWIEDSAYDPKIEGKSAWTSEVKACVREDAQEALFTLDDIDKVTPFGDRLQNLHDDMDNWRSLDELLMRAIAIGEVRGLTVPPEFEPTLRENWKGLEGEEKKDG